MRSTFLYNVSLPFRNLTPQSRLLQLFRLFTSFTALIFVIFTLVGPLISYNVFIARINCAHLDVSLGLYKSLRNSVSLTPTILDDSSTNAFPVDSSLTNSEISILTEYAENQVASAPQYIVTTLWNWCYGNYNTTTVTDKHNHKHTIRHDDTLTCMKASQSSTFDYRNELESIGLGSILAYAFQTTKYDDENYSNTVHKRHERYRLLAPALTFGAASQLVILFYSFVLYANRGSERDLKRIPSFVLNILALITVASFGSIAVASGIITRLMVVISGEILSTLGDFGVSLTFGSIWFLLLWLSFFFSLMTMASWILPLWCANPSEDDYDDESLYHYSEYARRTTNHRKRMSGVKDIGEIPMTDNLSRAPSARSNRSRLAPSRESKKDDYNVFSDQDVLSGDDDDELNGFYRTTKSSLSDINHFADDYHLKDEEELRILGETLSKKPSVRHLYKKSKSSRLDLLPEEDETKHLLYSDQNLSSYPNSSRHYREETFDGYVNASESASNINSANNSRSNSYKNRNNNRTRTRAGTTSSDNYENYYDTGALESGAPTRSNSDNRQFQHNTRNNPFLKPASNRYSANESLLNDDEIMFLDQSNYVGRYPK